MTISINVETSTTSGYAQKSSTPTTPTKVHAHVKKPYDAMDNKWRGYRYIWEVYPEAWKESWGNKPLLGYVRADSEFNACYSAFDKGLTWEWNYPFGITVNKATKFVRGI